VESQTNFYLNSHLSQSPFSCDSTSNATAGMKNAFGIFGEMTARWNPDTVLDSVKHGELKTLRHFFDQGCPIDLELNPNRDTALIVACRLGLLDVARLMLLEYGARNDPHPDYGHTALQHAVSSGHKSIVRLILDCAAPSGLDAVIVNHTDAHGEAPIHVACRCGSLDILQLLIEGGANVGVVDARGRTCLHLASQQGHASCLLCVLEAGADDFIEVRDESY
jgi:ankyrin repeat protein